ncbi:mob1 family protein [Geopyxis carbonaria]|nr:mob1 family protein [Geopyxis carbonaria]
MTTTSSSPSTSPRLPSPPPFTEVQIPPTPLSLSGTAPKQPPSSATSTRRIRPGTKSEHITTGPPLTSLSDLDSAFQLQEHLSSLLASTISPADSPSTFPLTRADAQRLATPPDGIEESLWCYELTRRLTRDLNVLIVSLLKDRCNAQSCPEMRASEWQYLCAVHESPQSCCAIDYSTHTLDQAATMLCSTKFFPSRLSLAQQSTKHLASIFRRLYRIFAHAWFQHRHCFWEVENELGLYVFFKTVSERYSLIPEDNLTLPTEAEGLPEGRHAMDEEEEEEEEEEGAFSEWNRGTGGVKGVVGDFGGSDEDEDDEDEEDAYSDESESDEEMLIEVEEDEGIDDEKMHMPEELPPLEEELEQLEIVDSKPEEEEVSVAAAEEDIVAAVADAIDEKPEADAPLPDAADLKKDEDETAAEPVAAAEDKEAEPAAGAEKEEEKKEDDVPEKKD